MRCRRRGRVRPKDEPQDGFQWRGSSGGQGVSKGVRHGRGIRRSAGLLLLGGAEASKLARRRQRNGGAPTMLGSLLCAGAVTKAERRGRGRMHGGKKYEEGAGGMSSRKGKVGEEEREQRGWIGREEGILADPAPGA